jgi:hypothetical protein
MNEQRIVSDIISEYELKKAKYINHKMGEIMRKLPNANIDTTKKKLENWFNLNIDTLWKMF